MSPSNPKFGALSDLCPLVSRNSQACLPKRKELISCSTAAADLHEHNADASLQNVIVGRTEYKRLKERNRDLEEQYRAIATSYSVLRQDVKEVEAKNKDLERRILELEAQLEVERRNGLEYARRELLLRTENDGLKALLSQIGGELYAVDEIRQGGRN
jgi:chromosome segregation ATPase